jgi:hypothetical protein
MGPFSFSKQIQRRKALERIIQQPIPTEMRAIWLKHLNHLAMDEDEYYRRVHEIYKNHVPFGGVKNLWDE